MTRRPSGTIAATAAVTTGALLGALPTGCGTDVTAASTPAGTEVSVASAAAASTADDTSESADEAAADPEEGAEDVFDAGVVHDIELTIDPDIFSELVQTYQTTGEKDWATATVTIDGETFEDVGVRLKGNSSLRDVSTSSDPSELPWLIRLDKYVDDQSLDGYAEFVVRSNTSQTSLNEAVALDLLELAGLASEQAIASRFPVNGADAELRLVVQNLDETWEADNFDGDGILYKAESTGDYSYRGDDPPPTRTSLTRRPATRTTWSRSSTSSTSSTTAPTRTSPHSSATTWTPRGRLLARRPSQERPPAPTPHTGTSCGPAPSSHDQSPPPSACGRPDRSPRSRTPGAPARVAGPGARCGSGRPARPHYRCP